MKPLSTGYQGKQFPFYLETDSNILEMFKRNKCRLKVQASCLQFSLHHHPLGQMLTTSLETNIQLL